MNNTIDHCIKFNETVLNTDFRKGIYKILHIMITETHTAPNKYGLEKILISNIECLSDLHSKTCNN